MIRDILLTKDIDVLVLDLELKPFKYFEVKSILKKFPKTKLLFSVGYLNKYMPLTPLKLVLLDMYTNKKSWKL
jgi:hypothetical protein